MFFDLPNDTNDISSNEHLVLDSSLFSVIYFAKRMLLNDRN